METPFKDGAAKTLKKLFFKAHYDMKLVLVVHLQQKKTIQCWITHPLFQIREFFCASLDCLDDLDSEFRSKMYKKRRSPEG